MATSMMPDAPAPQNRMMGPQAPQMAPQMAPGPMGPAPNAMHGPQPAPQGAPSPEKVAEVRQHLGAIVDGLLSLTTKPRGDLTKKDVFDAASEMIAKGAFPTPDSKQELIVHLAGLPDDEPGMRKFLGQFLLQVSGNRAALHSKFGAA